MDLIEESDGDAACPRARKNGTALAHADREYFGHLAFGGPRVFDWRRGAVFQTWHYSSVCPAPEDKMGRKMKALREQAEAAERRAASAAAAEADAINPVRKELAVGRATAARAEAIKLREEYFRTKSELKAARASGVFRRSGKKPSNSPKNLVLDGASRNCGGAWAKGDARKAPVLDIFGRDRGAKFLFARKFDSTSSGLLDAVDALIAEDV